MFFAFIRVASFESLFGFNAFESDWVFILDIKY
jgi:hypothetical protein